MLNGVSPGRLYDIISKKYGIGVDQIDVDKREARKVLGKITKSDRQEMVQTLAQDFARLAEKAEKNKNFQAAATARMHLANLYGAFKPEQVEFTDKTTEKLLAKIDPDKLIDTVFGIVEND